MSGRGSAVKVAAGEPAQSGGSAAPDSAHAACRAAPMATYSAGSGTVTGTPNTAGAMDRTAGDRAAPPMSTTRPGVIPQAARLSIPSASEHSTASTAARAMFSGVRAAPVMPFSTPVASGRFGDRSPSKYGSRVRPPAPGGAASASLDSPAASVPSSRAVRVRTRAALTVATSGRNRPVASANPATAPVMSAAGTLVTAYAVPEVPIETTTSPSPTPSPSAAPMLSPVPGDSTAPPGVRPTTSDGAASRGVATGRPSAISAMPGSHFPSEGE